MWILILTICTYSGYHCGGGPAIAAVPGFTSEQACKAAAIAWLERTQPSRADFRDAICAKA